MGKRRPAEDVEELDARRKRIRVLEREKEAVERQCEATKMGVAQRELVMRSIQSLVEEANTQADSLEQEVAQQREELEAMRQDGQCIVCMDEVATHVMVPCGHLALCQQCSGLTSSRCPLCRQPAERVIRVFRP